MAVAQYPESILPQVTSLGKDQNSKFKLQFLLTVYHFHTTARSKKRKLNKCLLCWGPSMLNSKRLPPFFLDISVYVCASSIMVYILQLQDTSNNSKEPPTYPTSPYSFSEFLYSSSVVFSRTLESFDNFPKDSSSQSKTTGPQTTLLM